MDAKFKEILDDLPEKTPRSRLEPYRELIRELRQRGRTYRDIADILGEKCQIQVTGSGVHDFVRKRSRAGSKSAKQISTNSIKTVRTGSVMPSARKSLTDGDIRRRIESLKARKPKTNVPPSGFQFDPTQPLQLKKPAKVSDDN